MEDVIIFHINIIKKIENKKTKKKKGKKDHCRGSSKTTKKYTVRMLILEAHLAGW